MGGSRLTEGQISAILAEQERGGATAQVRRRHGISDATLCASGRPSTPAWPSRTPAASRALRARTRGGPRLLLAGRVLDDAVAGGSGSGKG